MLIMNTHHHPAQVSSEFQAYKHVEIIGPGEYARAGTPLEATLSFHPTIVLTNALPHSMDVIIWQVGCASDALAWVHHPVDGNSALACAVSHTTATPQQDAINRHRSLPFTRSNLLAMMIRA